MSPRAIAGLEEWSSPFTSRVATTEWHRIRLTGWLRHLPFETADESFDYYRDYHAFWKLYGMNLPDAVPRTLYYQNALKLIPGLPRAGFP